MQETRCSKCGAIFIADHEGAVCPFCGAEASAKVGAVLSFLRKYWILVLGTLVFLAVARPPKEAWMWIGLLSLMGALGLACFFFWRAKRRQADEQPLSLGVEPLAKTRPDPWSVPLSPPKVPDRWRQLVDSRPPRDVYMPSKIWQGFIGETFYVVVVLGGYLTAAGRHHMPWLHFFDRGPDAGGMMLVLTYFASVGSRVKSFLTARDIMRDGEVTIAYTVDRSGKRATYQFWTKTGQTFQSRTRLIKRSDFTNDFGLVPVFYMPENPHKSVALYGTEFSIRLLEPAAAELQKAPAKA
jgi:hypothetical protein